MKTVILSVLALCLSVPAMAEVVFNPSPAVNNCTTALQKQQLRGYLTGRNSVEAPACYKAGSLTASAPVNNCTTALEKQALRRALTGGKGSAAAPACYKAGSFSGRTKSSAACTTAMEKQQLRRYLTGNDGNVTAPACYK